MSLSIHQNPNLSASEASKEQRACKATGKLNHVQVSQLKVHFDSLEHPPSWFEIQSYIKEQFHLNISKHAIFKYRPTWGLPTKTTRTLKEFEVSLVKEQFQDRKSPPLYTEISDFIQSKFGISYHKHTVQRQRRRWGILTKEKGRANRALTPSQKEELKAYFMSLPSPPTSHEVQVHIKNSLGIEYTLTTINKYQSEWGFPVSDSPPPQMQQPQHRNLLPDEIERLKSHYGRSERVPSWDELRQYIKEQFSVLLNQYEILHYRSQWGIPTLHYAQHLTKDDTEALEDIASDISP